MKRKHIYNNILMAAMLIIVAVFMLSCQKEDKQNDKIVIQYYYYNVCGSCDPEGEFIHKFEQTTGISADTPNILIEMHNVKDDSGEKAWQETMQELDIKEKGYSFPVLIIGDEVKSSGDIDVALDSDVESLLKSETESMPLNASAVVYFYAPGCHDCERVEENVVSKLPKELVIDGEISEIYILKETLSDSYGLAMFNTYCSYYNVEEKKQRAPIVFVGYYALSGYDEILKLPEILNEGESFNTPMLEPGENGEPSGSNYSLLGVLATGFINGLNPCSISMILMLLSMIAMDKKRILKMGLSFALGKFLGFMLLGTVLFSIINEIDFDGISSIIKIVLIAFSGIMFVLNINDFFAAKNENYKKIKLQLPKAFRKKNHGWIKKMTLKASGKLIMLAGLALGILISAGEFLCTGQIYVAVIAHGVQSGAFEDGNAFIYMILYSAAFALPLLLMILFILKGKSVFELSEKFRNNMAYVKLANAAIFLALIALGVFIY